MWQSGHRPAFFARLRRRKPARFRCGHPRAPTRPARRPTTRVRPGRMMLQGSRHPQVAALRACPIAELARLGRTLHVWRDELVAHFDHPNVSNGPTENLNLKIKNTKRIARGYRNFDHYRLRLLLTTDSSAKITHRRESEAA